MSTVTTNGHRARLAQIRERTRVARESRARARQTLDAARAADDMDAQAVASLALDTAAIELETAEQLERMVLSSLAGVDNVSGLGGGFLDDPQALEQLERMAFSQAPIGRADLGYAVSRDEYLASLERSSIHGRSGYMAAAGDVVVPDAARTTYFGAVPQLARPLTVLSLFPVAAMSSGSLSYTPISGNLDTAAEVAEGAIKATADIVLDEATAKAETLAHFHKIPKAALADTPGLQTVLTDRLVNGVNRRIETAALTGDGVSPHLQGVLTLPGIQTPAAGPNDTTPADVVLTAKVAVNNAGGVADGIVMHPDDVAAALKEKAVASGVRLDGPGAFASVPNTMWGLPLAESVAMPVGKALVADFSLGVTLLVREGVHVLVSDSDADDFTRNRITLLGEARVALAWWQPSLFAVADLAIGAPLTAEKGAGAKSKS